MALSVEGGPLTDPINCLEVSVEVGVEVGVEAGVEAGVEVGVEAGVEAGHSGQQGGQPVHGVDEVVAGVALLPSRGE